MAAIGIGSKIHHAAQRQVTAAVQQTADGCPETANAMAIAAATIGPPRSLHVLLIRIVPTSSRILNQTANGADFNEKTVPAVSTLAADRPRMVFQCHIL